MHNSATFGATEASRHSRLRLVLVAPLVGFNCRSWRLSEAVWELKENRVSHPVVEYVVAVNFFSPCVCSLCIMRSPYKRLLLGSGPFEQIFERGREAGGALTTLLMYFWIMMMMPRAHNSPLHPWPF